MAVATVTEPLLKSAPDMAKLNSFSGLTVTVTKHMAPRGTTGQMVVPTQAMSKEQLLALLTSIPLQYGPGFYRFEATDTGGQGEDKWMVKLGTEVMPTQEGLPMGQPPYMQQPPVPGAPLDPEVKQIMPGYFFNEALGLLTTPWRETVQWRIGEALPRQPASAGHLSLVPPNATPWGWPGQQQPGGWGSYPATETKSTELEAMKLQLAESERRREETDRRREDREREDRREAEAKRDREAAEARFEKMFAALTAKPSGPSESEQRFQREAEETRRRLEESERRAAEDRKEAQRREEARIADERHREQINLVREEMKAVAAAATANKTDPMMTLFGTILQTQAAGATETARMIRETSQAAQAASERSTTQVLDLARSQRETASESSKTVLEGMKGLMEMQTGVYNQLLEVAGNSGGQPWYAGVLQEGVGKIGLLGQALMERNQQPAQPQYVGPQRIVQARPGQPMARPMPGRPAAPQVAAAPEVPGNTGTRPPEAEYDPVTEEFVFPDGWRVKQAVVQQTGWATVLKRRSFMGTPVAVAAPAPTNGTTAPPVTGLPPAVAAPVAPDVVLPPAPAAKKKAAKNKKKGRAAAPAPEPDDDDDVPLAVPPPANSVGYTQEELRAMEPDQMSEIIKPLADEQLFGAMLQYVIDLRRRVASNLPVAKATEFILGTRAYANSFGGAPPPAFELLASGHLEVLVDRLLPDAPEEYQDAVINLMEQTLEAENPQGAEMAEQ